MSEAKKTKEVKQEEVKFYVPSLGKVLTSDEIDNLDKKKK